MDKNKSYLSFDLNSAYICVIISIFFVISLTPGNSMAKVKGKCVNCHTMHNSQDGIVDPNGQSPTPSLLNNDCIGCHSSDESSTYYDLDIADPNDSLVPEVNYTGPDAPVNYLAGGNFWWVKEGNSDADDSKGHNVFPGEKDDNLSKAPGGISCSSNSCHDNFDREYTGADPGLYGRQGCTGCHMVDDIAQPGGYHHADDGNEYDVINNFPWYRFLKSHIRLSGIWGVMGIEDPKWQAMDEADSESHNEYLGKDGGYTSESWSLANNLTVTAFCCGCHGKFHMQQKDVSSEAWIRHPSDSPLPNSGEYNAYTTFDPDVPVARPDLSSYSGPNNSNRSKVTPDEDLVMCLSCHRPHGSPYPDILRWDYDDMRVGSANTNGCFVCHTQKN
jgi:predicted CXXCH cytochrome family protein